MRWSISLKAEGDEPMSHEQILDLADAVAEHSGVATGVGAPSYGAQIIVEADNRTLAEHVARKVFADSAEKAGLPAWPITQCEALSEEEDLEPNMY